MTHTLASLHSTHINLMGSSIPASTHRLQALNKKLLYFAEGSLVFDSGGVNLLTILQQKIKSRKVLDSYVQHSKMGEHAS